MIVLNLKAYEASTGEKGFLLAKQARECASMANKRVILCPSQLDVLDYARRLQQFNEFMIFSQGADANGYGAFTGSVSPAQLAAAGVSGVLLNHAERKLKPEVLKATVKECKKHGLVMIICADSVAECKRCAALAPYAVAYEPPELIGKGLSVSKAKPAVVQQAAKAVKKINRRVLVLVGAGVSNATDVNKSFELGADGVLLASAFAKATDAKAFLNSLLEQCPKRPLCCEAGTCEACGKFKARFVVRIQADSRRAVDAQARAPA